MHSEPTYECTDVYLGGYRMQYHTIRVPTIVVSTEGTLVTFAEARRNSSDDIGDIDLVTRRSTDKGKTWDDMKIVSAEEGDVSFGNPCPIADLEKGIVHLVFTREDSRVYHTRTEDNGISFTSPTEISDGFTGYRKDFPYVRIATGPVHGIQMKDGRLVIPFWMNDKTFVDIH